MYKLIIFYSWKVLKYIVSKNRLKCLKVHRDLKIEKILEHGSRVTGAGNGRSIKYLIVYKLIIPFYISIKLYTIYIDFINIFLSSLFISYTL